MVLGSFVIPAGHNQNVRVAIPDSRFRATPLPAGVRSRPMASQQLVPGTPANLGGSMGSPATAGMGGTAPGNASLPTFDPAPADRV